MFQKDAIVVRRSEERGFFDHGWLKTRHSFSFSEFYDPDYMAFRHLRVINEDTVEPGEGFDEHPHRDMEIITCVMEGALEHKDSMGNGSVIRPGELQRMSAGTGITHSEYNHSKTEPVHFFQIWVIPKFKGIDPEYEQKSFPEDGRNGRFQVLASPDGRDDSIQIHQDVSILRCTLEAGHEIPCTLGPDRYAWIQLIRGELSVSSSSFSQGVEVLKAGDGAGIRKGTDLRLKSASAGTDFLFFDLD